MLRMGVNTKLGPAEVISRARQFFGPDGGYGLKITSEDDTSICFEGGGGSVDVVVGTLDSGATVDLVSSEWDQQVREFIGKIH